MHVTLAQWNRLTPEQRAQVTSIDATIVEDYPAESQGRSLDDWDYESVGTIPNPEAAR